MTEFLLLFVSLVAGNCALGVVAFYILYRYGALERFGLSPEKK